MMKGSVLKQDEVIEHVRSRIKAAVATIAQQTCHHLFRRARCCPPGALTCDLALPPGAETLPSTRCRHPTVR